MPIPDSIRKLQMKFQYRTEAEIAGIKFGLQVLSLHEEQKVQALPTDDVDGIAYYSEMQKAVLSYSIRSIDGEELPDVIEDDGADGKTATKERPVYVREVLDGLPHQVTERLFDIYIDLREQKEEEINSSLSYSWYKTPEQRNKERQQRERESRERMEAEEREEAERGRQRAAGATGAPDIPSPDDDIDLERLPDDHSDADAPPKS